MLQVKQKDLFEPLLRGVWTDICKLCGAKVGDRETHIKWHNRTGN